MNPEYGEIISENLALLNRAMEPVGIAWEWEHTGGGCDAFIHNLNNGGHYLITIEDDARIPTVNEWDNICLGLYDDDSEIVDLFVGSLSEAVALFKEGE